MIWTTQISADALARLQRVITEADDWIDAAPSAAPAIRNRKSAMTLGARGSENVHSVAAHVINTDARAAIDRVLGAYSLASSRVLLYKPGDGYGWHVDAATTPNRSTWHVSFSLVIEPPIRGGELDLDLGSIGPSLSPPAGGLVLWPAELTHRVRPIEQGRRVVVTGSIRCDIADPFDREINRRLREAGALLNEQPTPDPRLVDALAYAGANFDRRVRG